MSAHFHRGPSAAHRWRPCPGSIEEEAGLPDDAGWEAAYGTVFHEYAALCLEFGLDPYVFIDKPCETDMGVILFDQEMAEKMLYGLDYVRDIAAQPGVLMFVEVKVDISPWVGFDVIGNPGFGTSDVILVDVLNRRIIIFDWKYGAGVPVAPEWNDQAILYLLGSWQTIAGPLFDWDSSGIEVQIIIEQPRAPGGGGIWPTTLDTLLAEGVKIKEDSDATEVPGAPRVPGKKQCSFCKAAKANTCKTRTEHLLSVFDTKLEEVDEFIDIGASLPLPKAKALTPEQRSFVLLNKDMVTKWFDDLHAEAFADAEAGRPTPGLKLVDGRSPARVWKDEKKVQIMLDSEFGDKAYTKKYLSPTGVEDAIGKKKYRESKFYRWTVFGTPGPLLVPETDKRPAKANKFERFDTLMDDDNLI